MASRNSRLAAYSFVLWVLVLVLPRAFGAETGDFDGNGRLSIADVVRRMDDLEVAVGSRDAFDQYPGFPCLAQSSPTVNRYREAGLTFLEFVRRSVPDPLPHWEVFTSALGPGVQTPLPADNRVSITLEPALAPGGTEHRFSLTIRLRTAVRLRALAVLIEDEAKLLRVPYSERYFNQPDDWINIAFFTNPVASGDLPLAAPPAGFLITNGRYVIQYGFFNGNDPAPKVIEPGEYAVVLSVRLPKGAAAGSYAMKILETSEVVLLDGSEAVAPEIGAPVTLTIEETVTGGWDEGIPPFEFDPETKQVLGQVRFRVANAEGVVPADGEPVLEAAPGEDIRLRVQLMTEVPLNALSFRLEWPSQNLRCVAYGTDGAKLLFIDPEDGGMYPSIRYDERGHESTSILCEKGVGFVSPSHNGEFYMLGDGSGRSKYEDRPLEYFKPLGEWRDVTEVQLHVSGCATPGEEILLHFRPFRFSDPYSRPGAVFAPYSYYFYLCASGQNMPNWSYDLQHQDGFIRVNEGPPRCPEVADLGLRVLLGSVAGSSGEEVSVPILASADLPGEFLHIGLESDPPEAVVTSLELDFKSRVDGTTTRLMAPRGQGMQLRECDTECVFGIPGSAAIMAPTEDRFAAVRISLLPADGFKFDKDEPMPDYPGRTLVEIGRLHVRIPAEFTGPEIRLKAASISVPLGLVSITIETGSIRYQDFYPASEFREGVIRVIPPGENFLRGDSNLDRMVDLSDAITTLTYLFLGGAVLECEDAGDVDDSGAIEITDAIFLLGSLFLGSGAIPPPSPGCGLDPHADGLGCVKVSCGQE